LELAKKEENLSQAFLFEEHLYIANKYRTFADRLMCDSIRLHYAEEMMQTAMQIEDADTIGIAITHYMDAMKHLGRKIDMEPTLKKVRSLESFVHNPDKYAKILCVTARKYAAVGDNDNAKKYLSKALLISMAGRAETAEVTGRRAAQQMLDRGDIKEAVQTYYSILLMRDSAIKEKDEAMAMQKEADEVFLHNIGLWTLLFLIIVCGITAFYYFQKRRKAESLSFKSEITALQETIAKHEHLLQDMEKSDVKNREEISAQKKTIEKLKNAIADLKGALDSCSSTKCKRILDTLEGIAFAKDVDALLQKIVNQVDDYEFSEAAETLAELEKSVG
jgi:tetratricopeptide (TPR) repeat protein